MAETPETGRDTRTPPGPPAETGTRPRRRKQRGANPPSAGSGQERMRAGYAKAEDKNRAAREALVPLEPGERPTAVTVGAILTTVVAAILWISCAVALVTGAKVNGEQVNVVQWAMLAAIVTLMAWGMWRARYWAVLGFQMSLVLLIIAGVLGLVLATSLVQILSTAVLVVGLSVMFWFMVKAMARIQMPEHPSGR